MKLCKDCKHAKRNFMDFLMFFGTYKFARCKCPNVEHKDEDYFKVTGDYNDNDFWFCTTCRSPDRNVMCGKEARFFEPKKEAQE